MMVEYNLLSEDVDVNKLREYINDLIEEDTFICRNEKVDEKTEKEWFKKSLESQAKGRGLFLIVTDAREVIGVCRAERLSGKESHNVEIGISIRADYRSKGIGQETMKEIVRLIKEKMDHERIFLTVFGNNDPGIHVYQKLGFKEIARLPYWYKHRGENVDKVFMELQS